MTTKTPTQTPTPTSLARVLCMVAFASTSARADIAKPEVVDVPPSAVGVIPATPPGDKVEEVDLDALEEDAKPARPAPAPAAGSTKVEEVNLDELNDGAPSPEYERSRWLLLLPLLAALVVIWNVDWREARVTAEIAAARAKRAPPLKKKGTP